MTVPQPEAVPVADRLRRRGQLRMLIALVILASWAGGVAVMVRREFFTGNRQRLAEAALRVVPGAVFYSVERNGTQVGFASTTIDTMPTSIDVVDYFIVDLLEGTRRRRASARTAVSLSRALTMRTFETQSDVAPPALRSGGRADGDSAIVFASGAMPQRDSQRVAVAAPIVLPSIVPLVVGLGAPLRVNRSSTVSMFNPVTGAHGPRRIVVRAESLFTVVDSATLDAARGEWVGASRDTVRAWRVESDGLVGDGEFAGWVDASGRVVETTFQGGFTLRRVAYEIAFENWRLTRDDKTVSRSATRGSRVVERSVIAAGVSPGRARLGTLVLRLEGADLRGGDLEGGRQALRGDTLRVKRENDAALVPAWSLLTDLQRVHREHRADLADEPLLQAHQLHVLRTAVTIAGTERDPRGIVDRLARWTHDSLAKAAAHGVPDALATLRLRRGDARDHAQLFVAFSRALGIPARLAGGLVLVNGTFYQHAWAEVWLRDWVAVDPTLGQFPADAAHVRLVIGGTARDADLLRLIGNLDIRVLEAR